LNKEYMKKGETPDFNRYPNLREFWDEFVEYKKSDEASALSTKNKANSKQNKYPHVLGLGRYAKKIPKWDAWGEALTLAGIVPATFELAPRSKNYMYA
ncbi:hypothetical protein BAE44_0020829, partial [Dichanthelium oligosanthes]